MNQIKYNQCTGRGTFECGECGHLCIRKAAIFRICPECKHQDSAPAVRIRYEWHKKPAGYTRIIPPEDIKRAKASMYRARSTYGVQFSTQHTFAGLVVQVVSLPMQQPRQLKELEY